MALQPWTSGELVTAVRLNAYGPIGEVGKGVRLTQKTGITGTETGVLRIDLISLFAGRTYRVTASGLRISYTGTVAATDHYKFTLRQQDGTVAVPVSATTTSTEIGRSEAGLSASNSFDNFAPIISNVAPGADSVTSFLLSFNRTTGAAVPTVQADGGGILLLVEDMGWSVGNNAINL